MSLVLVDTTIWSLALRRKAHQLSDAQQAVVSEWVALLRAGRIVLAGPIRQEILSGIRSETVFQAIRERLGDFRMLTISLLDYDQAAAHYNRCRARGIAATAVDMLICALADRYRLPVMTTDRDFLRYRDCLEIDLYREELVFAAD